VLPEFLGTLSQVPPVYSAVHVDGRRASEAARSGAEVTLRPRTVRIDRLDMLDYSPPEARVRVSCTKGTYIRSLARDIAARLGTCAYLSRLRRTRIGGFSVEEAHVPDDFDLARDVLSPAVFFDAVPALGKVVVRPEWSVPVSRGIRLETAHFERPPERDGTFGAFSADRSLLAIIEASGSRLRYLATFPGNV
jgi:tRNA pseudouridine55 synthase